jgi:succinyl-diaminopimelate desuccinylase
MTIDLTDPIALSQALVRCESVTPHEGGAITLLQNALETLGFACHRMTFTAPGTPDIENLYARWGTAGPNLCFAGHTDVVPAGDVAAWSVPPFAAEIRDGDLIGRGVSDMKGGIACFLAAVARRLGDKARPVKGSLSFLITGDEEGPSINGTEKVLDWLKARDERLDAAIVGEPSNPSELGDEIKIGRRGSLNAEIVVRGRQGHSAYTQHGNPVPKLARIIDRLSSQTLDTGTPEFAPSHLHATVISVPNTASNVIPGVARATVNIRYNDLWTRETIEDWVRLQIEAALGAPSTPQTWEVTFNGTGGVFLTKPGPLVAALTGAIEAVTGRRPALTTGGGTSDARFIKDHCPVVEFGLVNATIHAIDERVPLADLQALTAIYGRFIDAYFDVARA